VEQGGSTETEVRVLYIGVVSPDPKARLRNLFCHHFENNAKLARNRELHHQSKRDYY